MIRARPAFLVPTTRRAGTAPLLVLLDDPQRRGEKDQSENADDEQREHEYRQARLLECAGGESDGSRDAASAASLFRLPGHGLQQ